MVGLIALIAATSAAILTAINLGTRKRIAFNKEVRLKKSVLKVFDIPHEKENTLSVFKANVKLKKDAGPRRTVYEYYEEGKLAGVAFEIEGAGFWGPILAIVALDADLNTIKGLEILHQEETPGLGGRIAEAAFKNQFKGKPVEPEIAVDAITGATMTSRAFKKMINENVQSFKNQL